MKGIVSDLGIGSSLLRLDWTSNSLDFRIHGKLSANVQKLALIESGKREDLPEPFPTMKGIGLDLAKVTTDFLRKHVKLAGNR